MVAAIYGCIPLTQSYFPWRSLQKPKVPTKVAFFLWTAALGKILTIDSFRRRWVFVIDQCCMCKSAEETINCLLLHCPAAQELWSVVFILLGVLWVMPRGMLDLLASWQARFGRGNRVIWNVTPHYLMRCLWRERNARIFEGCKKSFQIISFPSSTLYLSG